MLRGEVGGGQDIKVRDIATEDDFNRQLLLILQELSKALPRLCSNWSRKRAWPRSKDEPRAGPHTAKAGNYRTTLRPRGLWPILLTSSGVW